MISIFAASKSHSGVTQIKKKKIDQRALSIDISDQQFRQLPLEVLKARETIEHLIADGNLFTESALRIPLFPKLKTLTLSENKIRNIGLLLQYILKSCPNLQNLILTGNPGCPPVNHRVWHKKYRKLVMKALPKLRYLDSEPLQRVNQTSLSDRSSSNSTESLESNAISSDSI